MAKIQKVKNSSFNFNKSKLTILEEQSSESCKSLFFNLLQNTDSLSVLLKPILLSLFMNQRSVFIKNLG